MYSHYILIVIIGIGVFLPIALIRVEAQVLSVAKIRRTQPVRIRPEIVPKQQSNPPSASSSFSSIASHNVIESEAQEPVVGPSFKQRQRLDNIDLHDLHEQLGPESRPLVEDVLPSRRNNARFGSATLIDPMAGTQSEHLDPMRDGVFARLRNRALHYGLGGAVGTGLTVGVLTAKEFLSQNATNTNASAAAAASAGNSSEQTTTTNAAENSSTQTENDYKLISNPFNSH